MSHQPRHHVPTEAEQARRRGDVLAAPLLQLPEITDFAPGRVLPVTSVGILDKPHIPYLRLADKSVWRLPEILRPWTQAFISTHLHAIQHSKPPMLPARIEFGVRNGQAVAELQTGTAGN